MIVRPGEVPRRDFYRLLISTVVPRPIGWISTVSREGVPNLAPFSFFNVLCPQPPILGFSPGYRSKQLAQDLGRPAKDTVQNIRETGEFVVNVVTNALAEQMNLTSGDYEADISEFDVANLETRASQHVKPPQVAASPINFECKLFQIIEFGVEGAGSFLVMGSILAVYVDDSVIKDGRVDGSALDLVGRMGGNSYTRTRERFELVRPERFPQQR